MSTDIPEEDLGKSISLSEIAFALKRRWKVVAISFSFLYILNVAYTLYNWNFNRIYRGGVKLLIVDPFGENSAASGGLPSGGGLDNQFFEELARNDTATNIPTLIEVLKSKSVLGKLSASNDIFYEKLVKSITITPKGENSGGGGLAAMRGGGGDAGILEISLNWHDPSEGKKILGLFTDTILNFSQKEKQLRLVKGINFLDSQSPELEKDVEKMQLKLAEFRRVNSMVDPLRTGQNLKRNEDKIRDEVLEIEKTRDRLLQARSEIVAGNVSALGYQEGITDRGSGARLTISDVDQSLLKEMQKVESQLAAARSTYQPDSLMVRGLSKRLENLRPLLISNQLDAVDAALALNKGRLMNAKKRAEDVEEKFLFTQNIIREYEGLQERLAQARSKLSGLTSAREAFEFDNAQNSVPWRIISPPGMSSIPFSPRPKRDLLVGFVFSLVSSAVIAYFLDLRQNVFYSSKSVFSSIKLPGIIHIPFLPVLNNLKSFTFSRVKIDQDNLNQRVMINLSDLPEDVDSLVEFENSFRKLYSIIKFVHYDKDLKSIVFTSSVTSEGKSLLVSSFAIFLSQLGRKVLLIDGDLRKPRLHTLLNLKLEKGFSDLLDDDNYNLAKVTKKIGDVENLDFISAGLSLTEPTILFSSPRLQLLINSINESSSYDYILIDTPPSLICSDASLITRCCSTSLYIVSLRNVKKNMAIEALKSFTESNDKCLGIISNSTKFELNSVDSYSKAYSSYYNNSSLFNAPNAKSVLTKTSKFPSILKSLVYNKRTPIIVRKAIESSSRFYYNIKEWFID
ncbi:capsular exopolysaccharide family domain protein [Synechococcus sp. A15-62]|uniref:GumC family protein n=1 Tax=Synechococcus sp. A15-62 TaxID=1050657 RepID=UPI0016468455|nr:polysaccharide biosynthesis tyrosine autokinase [Synechococcus sp. A15-62]QNJ00624.1 capsular exopolysaccharide family domain protein [Synechococcus sp. A15-62]